jgi:hypothetical protein
VTGAIALYRSGREAGAEEIEMRWLRSTVEQNRVDINRLEGELLRARLGIPPATPAVPGVTP